MYIIIIIIIIICNVMIITIIPCHQSILWLIFASLKHILTLQTLVSYNVYIYIERERWRYGPSPWLQISWVVGNFTTGGGSSKEFWQEREGSSIVVSTMTARGNNTFIKVATIFSIVDVVWEGILRTESMTLIFRKWLDVWLLLSFFL